MASMIERALASARDRQLIALSSTHRQRVVCFSTWINHSEAKRTGYLGYIGHRISQSSNVAVNDIQSRPIILLIE